MQTRQLGSLWPVSALTLGGGGLGQLWGETSREEAVATARAAVEGGITLLDMAPGYGRGEQDGHALAAEDVAESDAVAFEDGHGGALPTPRRSARTPW